MFVHCCVILAPDTPPVRYTFVCYKIILWMHLFITRHINTFLNVTHLYIIFLIGGTYYYGTVENLDDLQNAMQIVCETNTIWGCSVTALRTLVTNVGILSILHLHIYYVEQNDRNWWSNLWRCNTLLGIQSIPNSVLSAPFYFETAAR